MNKEIIAIDGPAASGKSTVAKRVAKELGYKYIDSGAMYRCVVLYMLQNNLTIATIVDNLAKIRIDFATDNRVFLNDVDVSESIRSIEVTNLVPKVAAIKKIREKLVEMQQAYGQEKGIVMDGRDIGTVVFKEAKLKIYQVASVEARALRRHQENLDKGRESNLEMIKQEIEQRDYDDMNREISPLTKALDAVELDTSNLTIEENVKAILDIFNKKVMI